MNHETAVNSKNLADLLTEIKDEILDFLQTRVTMLKVELEEKSKNLKTAAILAVIGILMLTTAYMLFTLALVSAIMAAFPNTAYRWFLAFLAVGVFWSIFGALAAYFAKRELELRGILPRRTIEVLKRDKVWVQTEVKNQI